MIVAGSLVTWDSPILGTMFAGRVVRIDPGKTQPGYLAIVRITAASSRGSEAMVGLNVCVPTARLSEAQEPANG